MSIFQVAKLQGQQASEYGFDWNSSNAVMQKVLEETQELHVAVQENDEDGILHEMGDVLLALSSLSRHSNLSMEKAFEDAVERFKSRWNEMQRLATVGNISLETISPAEWEALWEKAKAELDRRT